MTGATHRVGGVLAGLISYSVLQSRGMLIAGVNPLLQFTIMYSMSIYGSTFPDLDHGEDSIPSKDIVSVAINKLLHLTKKFDNGKNRFSPVAILNAKHRSWQTHSELFLVLIVLLYLTISDTGGTANAIILQLVFSGFMMGIISHLVLDMLNPEGIWSIVLVLVRKSCKKLRFLPEKIHLVPKTRFFATDGPWERIIRRVMWFLSSLLFIKLLYTATML